MSEMYYFYIIALIPTIVGLLLYLFTKRINITEWIGSSIAGFIIAGIMHICAYQGMVSDVEIWSGQVTSTIKYPFWVERYQVSIYKTESYPSMDSDGNLTIKHREVFDHYEWRYRDHNQYFTKNVSYGIEAATYNISGNEFDKIVKSFGGNILTNNAPQSGFYSGDPNIYSCNNKTGYIIPATITKSWSNKVKSSPSTFSFQKVPPDAPLYEYPQCLDMWSSDRLLGDAGVKINTLAFDQLNSKLGPRKHVNIIIVGFTSADANLGKLQEAKWVGGKKNDVVICYGYAPLEGNIPNVCWTYAFSWCKNEQMKRNLEKIFYDGPIDNTIIEN